MIRRRDTQDVVDPIAGSMGLKMGQLVHSKRPIETTDWVLGSESWVGTGRLPVDFQKEVDGYWAESFRLER